LTDTDFPLYLAVIVAVPFPTAVTTPSFTVATDDLEVAQEAADPARVFPSYVRVMVF
jgi:hypothetical protein